MDHLSQTSVPLLSLESQFILDTIQEGIIGLDEHGRAIFCNDPLLKMLGYQREELIGRHLHELLQAGRRDRTSVGPPKSRANSLCGKTELASPQNCFCVP